MAQATLSDALRLSVRPRLALGALLGSDSDLGLSGYLRAAKLIAVRRLPALAFAGTKGRVLRARRL